MKKAELRLAFDEAIAEGDLDRASAMFGQGLDPNDTGPLGGQFTPLVLAAGAGALTVVQAALRNGANVNKTSGETRSTALHITSIGGWVDVAECLLAAGANIAARDLYRATPLHNAAVGGWPDLARTLLRAGADVRAKNRYGATPLVVAAGASWQASEFDRELRDNPDGIVSRPPARRDHVDFASVILERGPAGQDVRKAKFFAEQYGDLGMQRLLSSVKSEGCFIATAVYGSYEAPQVLVLRRFRDETLGTTSAGRAVIRGYYLVSPWLATRVARHSVLSKSCRRAFDASVRLIDR